SESDKPPLPMDAIVRAKQHLIPLEATSFRDLLHIPAHHEHPFRANVNTNSGLT
ncbi:hypothetical protein BY454_1645, partial [Marinobacter persicus]